MLPNIRWEILFYGDKKQQQATSGSFKVNLISGFDIRTNYTKPEASLTMRALLNALCIGARY